MRWIVMLVVGLVIAGLAIFYGMRYWRRRRTMKNMRAYTSRITARVVNRALRSLQQTTSQWPEKHLPLTPIAHTRDWGHKAIMVYEFAATGPVKTVTPAARHELQAAVDAAAQAEGIVGTVIGVPPFAVVDVWQRQGERHFSVAFQINQATIEYVQDITRAAREDAAAENEKKKN